MANALYDPGREGFLDGSINWTTGSVDDIRVMLVRTGYSFSAAHKFMSDVTTEWDNGRSATLAARTATNGVADADDVSLTAVTGSASNAVIIYQNNGSDATNRLIAYIDTATGLPVTPAAAGTVNIAWDSGANKIFKL